MNVIPMEHEASCMLSSWLSGLWLSGQGLENSWGSIVDHRADSRLQWTHQELAGNHKHNRGGPSYDAGW